MDKKLKLISAANFVAEASLDNPHLGWLEFILTDDQPNLKKQGVHQDAFASIVSTGMLMPLKVAQGEIRPDHSEAEPLGAIASLTAEATQILGKAALWKEERPQDYNALASMSKDGEPINISWEIAYSESTTDADGVEWIADPTLMAATIVGSPAYAGRTPVISVASVEDTPEDKGTEDAPPDDTLEDDNGLVGALKKQVSEMESEMTTLRTYKEARESQDTEDERLSARTQALEGAGIKYEEGKKEYWLDLSDDAFTTTVDMFKVIVKNPPATTVIPNITGQHMNNEEVVRLGLKEMKKNSLEEN